LVRVIKLIRGISATQLDSIAKDKLRLNLKACHYTKKEIYSMSSDEVVRKLDKFGKIRWLNRDKRFDDAETFIRTMTEETEKISSPKNYAKMRDKEIRALSKNKAHGKDSPRKINLRVDITSGKKHRFEGKDVLKKKTSMSPRKLPAMKIFNKLKGLSITSKLAIGVGSVVGMTLMTRSMHDWGLLTPTNLTKLGYNQSSTYIPEKYSRGYDTIKEATTDFGSSIRLDKVSSKVNVTPKNSTRHAFITNTSSVMRSNLALNSHNNAINHTRY